MTGIDSNDVLVLRTTDAALAKVLELRAREDSAGSLALWLEVSGAAAGAYTYDMYFQAIDDATTDDVVQRLRRSLGRRPRRQRRQGARRHPRPVGPRGLWTGMVINNPNRPGPEAGTPRAWVARPRT